MGVFSKYHRFREAGEEANVIFGVMFDENEADDVTITVIYCYDHCVVEFSHNVFLLLSVIPLNS